MERLTKFSGGIWAYKDQCGKAITLLAEYENTGLTPKQIREINTHCTYSETGCGDCEYTKLLVENEILKNKLNNAFTLPFNIGDTVFVVTQYGISNKEIICCKVGTMRVTKKGIVYSVQGKYNNGNCYIGTFAISSIGKTIFLTEEDAKRKLRRIK